MSKWTGKKSPVNLPRGRRDSASINISHFHKGIPVWIENTYEEKSSHYRSTLLPVNYSTRPTWIPQRGCVRCTNDNSCNSLSNAFSCQSFSFGVYGKSILFFVWLWFVLCIA